MKTKSSNVWKWQHSDIEKKASAAAGCETLERVGCPVPAVENRGWNAAHQVHLQQLLSAHVFEW
jgi:hypothetical protein